MTGPNRLSTGGRLLDRSRTIEFTLDNASYRGHPGDTVASALLANGVRVVGRSVLLERPRGVLTADADEPNALLHVVAPDPAPMLPATEIPLVDGLVLRTLAGRGILNGGRPTSGGGIGGGNDGVGRADHGYLHVDELEIDLGRGIVRLPLSYADPDRDSEADPDNSPHSDPASGPDNGHASGADNGHDSGGADNGPANGHDSGSPDNDAAGESGAGPGGGSAQRDTRNLGNPPGDTRYVEARLVGEYDHGWVLAVVGRRLEHIRARTVRRVGSPTDRELPLLFPGNDRPGVMLAGAVSAYLRDHAVRPGRRAVLVTDHDGGLHLAHQLRSAGIEVLDVVDHRDRRRITGTYGNGGPDVAAVTLSDGQRIECDLVVVSGRLPESVPVLDCDPATARDQRDSFVDLERDVTVADLAEAVGHGLRSIELIKRHTLLGTGPAQGRLASRLATAVVAELLGVDRATVGGTRTRPPARPVRIDVLAGRHHGPLYDPVRVTALHDWHTAYGAVFEDVGQWKRPRYFPRRGATGVEDMASAVDRECRAARGSVAMMDASTLGKIELRGPDTGEFLDRLYTNRMSTLKPGRCRYGILCGADGMVLDDGVVARFPSPDEQDQHYYATTTTGNAAAVLDWMEEWLRTEWPELRVSATSVTDHWATIALVGPRSGRLLAELAPDLAPVLVDDPEAFGFMTVRTNETDPACTVAGVPDCRIFRISFSGELAYEINVPWWYGLSVWEALIGLGVTPYGTETMHVLRAEKGFAIVGQETDGTVTPYDLGMDWIVSKKKDFVGRRSFTRPDTARADRRRMVGLFPEDPAEVLPEGAQLVRDGRPVGYVTSSYPSATLGRSFALAMVAEAVEGERLVAPLPERSVEVRVTSPRFLDAPTT